MHTLHSMPQNIILYQIDFVRLYPNIPYQDGLVAMRKALVAQDEKTFSINSFIESVNVLQKVTYSNIALLSTDN